MTQTNPDRWSRLAWAAVFAGLLTLVSVLVRIAWQPLQDLDTRVGTRPFDFTRSHELFAQVLRVLQHVTEPDLVLAVMLVAAVVLAVKGHRRAAIWGAVVLVATRVLSLALKQLVGRERPVWDDPVEILTSNSFPSSHAAQIAAAAGVLIVWEAMLVRRRGLRRLLFVVAVVLAFTVGADRIFLGVHNLSDVVAGFLLGGAVTMLALGLFDPKPKPLGLTQTPMLELLPAPERTLAAVLNPIKVEDPAAFRTMVEALANAAGFGKVLWWETTVDDTGYSMAHRAAVSGASLVLAIGGDGTIRAVCEELAGTGIPVGIVPAGTGNLLARNLNLPLYLRSAVDLALNGQDRAIDMVNVSGDHMEDATFLVMAGMGFDAAIMEGVNEQFKAKVGWLAYVWSALRSLLFPAISVEVSVDGAEFTKHKARTIVIGNVGNLQAGMPLIPDATIDDGLVDVVLLYPRRFLSWLPLAARVLTKNPRTDETITRMQGREVVVRTTTDAPRQLDGDLISSGKELRASCVHGRLLVRVPR